MLHIIRYFLIVIFCASLYGCATIINGSTQDVTVIIPQGTQVSDVFENDGDLPITRHGNGDNTLRLKRKRDYTLRFRYKNQEVIAAIYSSLEPGWIAADLFTDLIGYVVDGITGAWNSFEDPIAIRFPTDTTQRSNIAPPIVEVGEETQSGKYGIVVSGKLGLVFPMINAEGFNGALGVGYDVNPKLTFLLAYDGGTGIDILSQYSLYNYFGATFTHYNLECRYKVQGNFYVTGGGGLSNITSDSLEINRYSFNDTTGQLFQNPIRTAPVSKLIPTLFVGVGLAGQTFYCELRHVLGLSKIPLANGESGTFQTTSLTFGINLHF